VLFAWKLKSVAAPLLFWLPLGIASLGASFSLWKDIRHHAAPFPLNVAIGILIAAVCWSVYCTFGRCVVSFDRARARLRSTEKLLWDALEAEAAPSHELSAAWSMSQREYVALARAFLVAVLMVLLFCRIGTWRLWLVGAFLFWVAAVVCYWLATVSGSPHRHQWKLRFYNTCLLWTAAASLPSLLLLPTDALGQSAIQRGGVYLRAMFVGFSLLSQAGLVAMAFRRFSDFKDKSPPDGYYSPPSARYEELSDALAERRRTWDEFRFLSWTLVSFVTFTALWWLAVLHLGSLLCSRVLYLIDHNGTGGPLWLLPSPLTSRDRTWSEIAVVCIMGGPIVFGFLIAIVARFRLVLGIWRQRDLVTDPGALNLPDEPLRYLEEQLHLQSLRVILVPRSDIEVAVGTVSIFRRVCHLWVSAGAVARLTTEEMEALLWHECHHAFVIRMMRWKHVLAILTPASSRILDLAGDLYQLEREADRFAADRMGTAECLISALERLQEQARDDAPGPCLVTEGYWDHSRMDYLRPLWDPSWAAYLHPDLEQRIRWLQGHT
jgi:hypothetical protein